MIPDAEIIPPQPTTILHPYLFVSALDAGPESTSVSPLYEVSCKSRGGLYGVGLKRGEGGVFWTPVGHVYQFAIVRWTLEGFYEYRPVVAHLTTDFSN